MKTINTLNELGKCFFIHPSEFLDFVRGTNLQMKTQIFYKEDFYKGIPATVYKIYLGRNRKEQLNTNLMPDGTEGIFIYDLKDGRQVIHYLHYHKEFGDIDDINSLKIVLRPFCNEFRAKEVRLRPEDFFSK